MVFADRDDAGRRLAARLGHLRGEPVVVLGLPRGGVPVAFQVARALGAPLDVVVVRKLGVPFQPELGMGAVGEDGVRVINPAIVHAARVSDSEVAAVQAREQAAVQARAARYRVRRAREPLDGRVAVVVDDGIATGSTARAACQSPGRRGRRGWCSPCPSRRRGGRHGSARRPTSWSAWTRREGSSPSGSSTPGSPRYLTRRSSPAWSAPPRCRTRRKPAPRAPPVPLTRRPAARKWSPAPASSGWLATWPCRRMPGGSWSSPMAAAAAGTAPATGMSPAS